MGNQSLCNQTPNNHHQQLSDTDSTIKLGHQLTEFLKNQQYQMATQMIFGLTEKNIKNLNKWVNLMRKSGRGYRISKLAETIWLSQKENCHDLVFHHFDFEAGVEPKKMLIGQIDKVQEENCNKIQTKVRYFYIGDIKDGKPHGRGTTYLQNGKKHTGSYYNGLKHGFGIFYGQKNKFEGQYANGKRNGYGTYFYKSGAQESVIWVNDKEDGDAQYRSANGQVYIKVYKAGKHIGNKAYNNPEKIEPQKNTTMS